MCHNLRKVRQSLSLPVTLQADSGFERRPRWREDWTKHWFHEQALRLRAQRQQLLATNIANADTPNYKAQDFDFAQAMKAAMAGAGNAQQLQRTHAAHQGLASDGMPQAQPRAVVQASRDGNTVDLDVERSAFTENALRYEAGVTILSSKLKGLSSVIQG